MTAYSRSRVGSFVCALLAAAALLAGGGRTVAQSVDPKPGSPPIQAEGPALALNGYRSTVVITAAAPLPAASLPVEIRLGDSVLARGLLESGGEPLSLEIAATPRGVNRLEVRIPGHYRDGVPVVLRAIPGWLTLLPPLLAILLALAFRQVVPALLAGIWIGAWIYHGGPFVGALHVLDRYVVGALADKDNVSIVVFTLLLGGMVGLISRSGGTRGLVDALASRARTARGGQLATWLLGIVVFFDDYANTLLVGNTMRPVTDRLRISREKLAYIVDSTAAPVASIALVSTWIGYEVSLIGDSLESLGLGSRGAYGVFLESLPYNFYPILALVFGFLVAFSLRDFGPMLRAERRALGGQVLGLAAVPLADFDSEVLAPLPNKPRRWINAVAPVAMVLLVTFVALWVSGRLALIEQGRAEGTTTVLRLGFQGLGTVLGAGDSFKALLYGSMSGCLTAVLLALAQRILNLGESIAAWVNGMKSMIVAMIILVLAWSIGNVCSDLGTSTFMVDNLSDAIDPRLLPAIVFALAAITAFSTGTSWATMAILIPLAVPTAHGVATATGLDPVSVHRILVASVSAVLAGALFGDHCSPISDTTVMSSMASGCDHIDHVRTQLPYALIVAVVAILFGYLPAGFGLHPLLCIVVGALVLAGLLRWVGRKADEAPRAG